MLQSIELPEELNISIGSENKDFAVKSKLARPARRALSPIISGALWLAFFMFFISFFLGPAFTDSLVKVVSSLFNPLPEGESVKEEIGLILFFGVFIVIGLGMIANGIYWLLKRGGYFVGTPTRLVWYKKGKLFSYSWEQFTGSIEVYGTNKRGRMTLELRTGRNVSGKGGTRYIPDVVYIIGVPDIYEIEQLCRKRIKENDPTPSSGS
jgi:hypothetical protein